MGSSRLYRKNSSQRTTGKIYSAEGKYTHVIFGRWRGGGRHPATLASVANAVFGPWMMEEGLKNFYVTDAIAAAACRQAVESPYAKATEEIEAHIPSRGRVLLSVDATNDTMFFAR
jgi:hypothetical protein